MNHSLIVTAAGDSTRYKNYGPKWALTHPSGNIMAAEAIRGISGYSRLVFVTKKEYVDTYGRDAIVRELAASSPEAIPEVYGIDPTKSQVETVIEAIRAASVEGAFTVKDCDCAFNLRIPMTPMYQSAVVDLQETSNITAANKSFATYDEEPSFGIGWANGFAEKRIVSRFFCCGAYTFPTTGDFLRLHAGASYMSEVLGQALRCGQVVRLSVANGYADWGTAEDWKRFRAQFCTVFVDIDGVLVGNGHRSFGKQWGQTPQINRNIETLNALSKRGRFYVVLTTSRPESAREVTVKQLEGLDYKQLVMGLPVCGRCLINDWKPERGERTARSIQVERDCQDIRPYLEAEGIIT